MAIAYPLVERAKIIILILVAMRRIAACTFVKNPDWRSTAKFESDMVSQSCVPNWRGLYNIMTIFCLGVGSK